MTVQCPHCRVPQQGKPGFHGGKSAVVETRIVAARTILRGKREYNHTVQRTRRCLTCGYRWRTREIVVPVKRIK